MKAQRGREDKVTLHVSETDTKSLRVEETPARPFTPPLLRYSVQPSGDEACMCVCVCFFEGVNMSW